MTARFPAPITVVTLTVLAAAPLATPLAVPASAQRPEAPDTTPRAAAAAQGTDPFFTGRDAWLALGFAAGTVAMAPFDRALAQSLQDSTLQLHGTLRGLAATAKFLGFPGSVVIGTSMYAAGRIADLPRVAVIGLHGTEAVMLSYAFVWTGKNLLGRARPDNDPDNPFNFGFARGFSGGSPYRSFPSGHTAAAFAVAAAVTAETAEVWPEATPYAGPVLYGGAVLVGLSRMYHNRHWASDAVMGAAVGTFSGLKVVRYHYRNPDNPVDRWLLPAALVPTRTGLLLVWGVPTR